MIGDIIELNETHLATAGEILEILKRQFPLAQKHKIAVGIAGESGSGKSVTAFALQKVLQEISIKSLVLQMDDYFTLPPKTNHENRLLSLDNIGPHEVNLKKLSGNIKDFKKGMPIIEKPLVHYRENSIRTEALEVEECKVIIVEGTYILELEDFDYKIFIDRNYKDTYKNRMQRNRDEQSDFVEKVLDIEHRIIRNFKNNADLILDKNYQPVIPQ
ncbi:uridine kinase family protein [Chryseobacterium camelliae]|uniref:uridine kinase family protein n=1 Tax=Chryseobacterium camelliae TaxID=1265445 RepID=UPI0028580CA7|nr:hypothetical protein [Chryseobacterium camelliae]MDR6516231.1 uridine kinase [Chryseobacterium camelliae]